MRKGSRLFTRMVTLAFAGVMAVGVCGNGNVAKASGESEEIIVGMQMPISDYYFPDENFRKYVQENFDSDNNGSLSDEERADVNIINVGGMKIKSLEGVELFYDLEYLHCNSNDLTELDLKSNTKLKSISCSNNSLTSLDLSNNTELEKLQCIKNQISTLNVSKCAKLTDIDCRNNKITELDISGLTELKKMLCDYNSLTSLSVDNNTKLETLHIQYNNLTSLDLRKCTKLNMVRCGCNQIENLYLNSTLEYLECNSNKLSSLDVTGCASLTTLICGRNDLSDLDVTKNKALFRLDYSDCKLKNVDISNNLDLSILVVKDNDIDELNIEKHTKLTSLDCSNNNLTKLDISKNTLLIDLNCSDNKLNNIDLSNNNNIKQLFFYDNQIKDIDISNLIDLEELGCAGNMLSNLDLTNNTKMEYLYCGENQLTELVIGHITTLIEVICWKNNIAYINCENLNLETLYKDDNTIIVSNAIKNISLSATDVDLEIGKTYQLSAKPIPEDAQVTELKWSSNNTAVATVDGKGLVTAKSAGTAVITVASIDGGGVKTSCTVTVASTESGSGTTDNKNYPAINISYRTHIQTYGWEGKADDITTWKSNGAMSGTSGLAKRLEGINIVVNPKTAADLDLGIQYTTHCQSYGWLPWSADGDMNGTEGEAKRLEAIKIQLTGADNDKYDVYYRVHAQSYGWLGWAKNGAPAGTAGYGKRLEGIQIVVVKTGESFNEKVGDITSAKTEAFVAKEGSSPIVNYEPTSNTNPVVPGADTVNVAYRTHVQSYGWQAWKYNGQMSGTSGQAKRLEGINIELRNKDCSGDIVYTTHVQTYGWQGSETDQSKWFKNGQMAGTSGEAKRLEAICINLTGEMAEKYDIYYRVHAQSYGWLGWAKNGAPSGTAGYGKRLEGIQIILVKKGEAAPGKSYKGIDSVNDKAYILKPASGVEKCLCGTPMQMMSGYILHKAEGYYATVVRFSNGEIMPFDGDTTWVNEYMREHNIISYSIADNYFIETTPEWREENVTRMCCPYCRATNEGFIPY